MIVGYFIFNLSGIIVTIGHLEVLKHQGRDISRGMLKGLEKRKQNLEVKLQTIAFSIKERTDDIVDFKMMGIDPSFWCQKSQEVGASVLLENPR